MQKKIYIYLQQLYFMKYIAEVLDSIVKRGRHGGLELGESEVIVEGLETICCLYLVLLNHNIFRTLSQFVVKWTE